MKVLYFDTETTGLDPKKHSIIQISGIIEIDGEVKEEFNFRCQPDDYDTVDYEALKVNEITIEQLRTFDTPKGVYEKLIEIFSKYIDKFDPNDKFYPAGHNVSFDVEFLSEFFKRQGDVYFGSWQNYRCIDSRLVANFLTYCGIIKPEHIKLSYLCEYFKIKIRAHDALSDIKATRSLIKKLRVFLKDENKILD